MTTRSALLALFVLGCSPAPARSTRPAPPEKRAKPAATEKESGEATTVGAALSRLRTGDAAGAVAMLTELTEKSPESGQLWIFRGVAERAAGDPTAAQASLERAAAIESSAPRAYYQLAVLAAATGDEDAAFEWLEKARATGKIDITGIAAEKGAAGLADDPRLAAMMPDAGALAHPFVEKGARAMREWRGEAAGDQFGWIARDLGDVDGDGADDVVTSAPTAGPEKNGKVYAFSSKTGRRLWVVTGPPGGQLGLGVETAGDVDGDGVPDAVAGAPHANLVWVLSGKDGSRILEVHGEADGDFFGRKVAAAGDVDGDGHGDIVAGAPRNRKARGALYLFSGKDGSKLHTWRGARDGDRFGAAAGAATENGELLLAVGAPDAGESHGGAVSVFRGLSDEPAFTFEADESGKELGGMFVSIVGDVDGDGAADVYASDWANAARGPTTGRAYVHSGKTGRNLYTFTGEAPGDGFGIGIADAGDVDGDGHADLVIGAWRFSGAAPGAGKVYLYKGADGSIIRTWTAKVMGETLGFDTTGLGDVDGDGATELLVSSGWAPVAGARSGRVFILSTGK